jgi:hypothetical protein
MLLILSSEWLQIFHRFKWDLIFKGKRKHFYRKIDVFIESIIIRVFNLDLNKVNKPKLLLGKARWRENKKLHCDIINLY